MTDAGRRARLLLAEFLSNELHADLDSRFLAATDKLLARLWLSGYAVDATDTAQSLRVEAVVAECLSEELGLDLDPELVGMAQRLLFRLRSRGVGIVAVPEVD